jgi:hypothetical protein
MARYEHSDTEKSRGQNNVHSDMPYSTAKDSTTLFGAKNAISQMAFSCGIHTVWASERTRPFRRHQKNTAG